jgi:hypothetical protein
MKNFQFNNRTAVPELVGWIGFYSAATITMEMKRNINAHNRFQELVGGDCHQLILQVDESQDFLYDTYSMLFPDDKEELDDFFHKLKDGVVNENLDLIDQGITGVLKFLSFSSYSNFLELYDLVLDESE